MSGSNNKVATIIHLNNPDDAASWCKTQRGRRKKIGFVPTMGALHDGHLSLARAAKRENDLVCVSIFVNPLQFNNPEDLENYPRDFDRDVRQLENEGCDMIFTGTLTQFFPDAHKLEEINMLEAGRYALGLEGDYRPGHFAGVVTIVERLFNTVGQCSAYFGEKDFQQCLVIRELTESINGIDIIICPTIREDSGLAMSSRNSLLSPQARERASVIYQALCTAQDAWNNGERRPHALSGTMHSILKTAGVDIEYATVRDPNRWIAFESEDSLDSARAFIAIRIDDIRLIDNMKLG